MDYIDNELYSKFVEKMPIACVDIVIHDGKDFLFVKRNQDPAKDKWWVVGGRLHKNETLEECAVRKCREEVGLDIVIEKKIGVYDEFFDTSVQGCPTHTVCVAFLAKPVGNIKNFVIDSTSDEGIVTRELFINGVLLSKELDPYVKRLLVDSGWWRSDSV